jgi:hypothetical protein
VTFRALRNVSLDPWRIGKIVAAAPVFLHVEHARTTSCRISGGQMPVLAGTLAFHESGRNWPPRAA